MQGTGKDARLRIGMPALEEQRGQIPVAEVHSMVERDKGIANSVTGTIAEEIKPSGEQQLEEQQQQSTYNYGTGSWHGGENATSSNTNSAMDVQLDGGWIYDGQSSSWHHPGEDASSMNSDGTGRYSGSHAEKREEHPQDAEASVESKVKIPLAASNYKLGVSSTGAKNVGSEEAGALIAERIKALELALHA